MQFNPLLTKQTLGSSQNNISEISCSTNQSRLRNPLRLTLNLFLRDRLSAVTLISHMHTSLTLLQLPYVPLRALGQQKGVHHI